MERFFGGFGGLGSLSSSPLFTLLDLIKQATVTHGVPHTVWWRCQGLAGDRDLRRGGRGAPRVAN